MKFWEKHDDTMRKNRLLQAAATIYANSASLQPSVSVSMAFQLEKEIEKRLKEE